MKIKIKKVSTEVGNRIKARIELSDNLQACKKIFAHCFLKKTTKQKEVVKMKTMKTKDIIKKIRKGKILMIDCKKYIIKQSAIEKILNFLSKKYKDYTEFKIDKASYGNTGYIENANTTFIIVKNVDKIINDL